MALLLILTVACEPSNIEVRARVVDRDGQALLVVGQQVGQATIEVRNPETNRVDVEKLEWDAKDGAFTTLISHVTQKRELIARVMNKWNSSEVLFESAVQVVQGGDSSNITISLFPKFESGLIERPDNSTCNSFERTSVNEYIALQKVFSDINIGGAVDLVHVSQDPETWYLVNRHGLIREIVYSADGFSERTVLDLTDRVLGPEVNGELGMLSLALHPKFSENGEVFIYYTSDDPTDPTEGIRQDVLGILARFVRTEGNGGAIYDANSEEIILKISFPTVRHHAGTLRFGPDHYLYLSIGDGDQYHVDEHSQNVNTLPGSILRIDIDSGSPYEIPPDNPFAKGGGRPELFAWGFRNPWRFSFDTLTGEIWVGDVGDITFEEIDIVVKGGNYGWSFKEGPLGGDSEMDFVDPVYWYSRDEGMAVIGGHVYRGSDVPYLFGKYIYGDLIGRVWALEKKSDNAYMAVPIASIGPGLFSLTEDKDGEIYLIKDNGIFKIIDQDLGTAGQLPQFLSMTGCVDAKNPSQPSAAMIEYSVAVPLWSDGAVIKRWMALPNETSAVLGKDGQLKFPLGTVLMKQFEQRGRLIETRFMVQRHNAKWVGYTYVWNEEQKDAELRTEAVDIALDEGDAWKVPDRFGCMRCHTSIGFWALGPQIDQLNVEHTYSSTGITHNQIETLKHIGIFDLETKDLAVHSRPLSPLHDQTKSLEQRARSYLHVNCSNCHQSGQFHLKFDFRGSLTFEEMAICNTQPRTSDFGIENARIFAPGEPERSLISFRMHSEVVGEMMPPLGRTKADDKAVDVIDAWIRSVKGCP
jgi:uncharacterized repeat protein (TIGR03806 family)